MTVFEAFPNAIEVWDLLEITRGTEVGTVAEEVGKVRVIVADGDEAKTGNTPNADGIVADLLLYAEPCDLPSMVLKEVVGGYGFRSPEGFDYSVLTIGSGKNQETGEVEHIEITLKMTEFGDE